MSGENPPSLASLLGTRYIACVKHVSFSVCQLFVRLLDGVWHIQCWLCCTIDTVKIAFEVLPQTVVLFIIFSNITYIIKNKNKNKEINNENRERFNVWVKLFVIAKSANTDVRLADAPVFQQIEVVHVFQTGAFPRYIAWRNDDVTHTALKPRPLQISWKLTSTRPSRQRYNSHIPQRLFFIRESFHCNV